MHFLLLFKIEISSLATSFSPFSASLSIPIPFRGNSLIFNRSNFHMLLSMNSQQSPCLKSQLIAAHLF